MLLRTHPGTSVPSNSQAVPATRLSFAFSVVLAKTTFTHIIPGAQQRPSHHPLHPFALCVFLSALTLPDRALSLQAGPHHPSKFSGPFCPVHCDKSPWHTAGSQEIVTN